MAEEVSPESKLYVKEEIEKSRKEIKEEVEKVSAKATKTFTTVAVIVGLLTGLGVFGSAAGFISSTINKKLDIDALERFENNKIRAEQNMKKAESLLEEILRLKKIAHLPIGTILPSMLDPNSFAEVVGDPNRTTWVLADGNDVTDSQYAKLADKPETPDLRGMFLRGMNKGRKDGKQDPNEVRKVGQYQADALETHTHYIDNTWAKEGGVRVNRYAMVDAGPTQPWNTYGAGTGKETRPKNVAVYFYIKIN